MGIDAIVSLVSLFGPKIMDTVKGWIHRKDSPEATVAALAQTNPSALTAYVEAQAKLIEAQNSTVNSDITGTVHQWVSDVRAMIRPALTIAAILHIVVAGSSIPTEFRYVYEVAISSWFGSRWVK